MTGYDDGAGASWAFVERGCLPLESVADGFCVSGRFAAERGMPAITEMLPVIQVKVIASLGMP